MILAAELVLILLLCLLLNDNTNRFYCLQGPWTLHLGQLDIEIWTLGLGP